MFWAVLKWRKRELHYIMCLVLLIWLLNKHWWKKYFVWGFVVKCNLRAFFHVQVWEHTEMSFKASNYLLTYYICFTVFCCCLWSSEKRMNNFVCGCIWGNIIGNASLVITPYILLVGVWFCISSYVTKNEWPPGSGFAWGITSVKILKLKWSTKPLEMQQMHNLCTQWF